MSLSDNTEKIRALIEGISALPDVGTGGGGLPIGVSALAAGSFTPVADIEESINITHNLGVKPNFYLVVAGDDYSEGVTPGSPLYCVAVRKMVSAVDYNGNPTKFRTSFFSVVYDIGEYMNYTATECPEEYDDEIYNSYFILWAPYANDVCPFRAGHTYRWICGVIDGIN